MSTFDPLPPAAQHDLLRGIVARAGLRTSSGPPVVVFDLDGTLMDNRPRSAAILRELSTHWNERHPHHAEKLAAAEAEEVAYLFSESLGRLGVHDPMLVGEAVSFWRQRFFVDEYLKHDVEVPGARDLARAVHEAGATVVYLTGRDLPLMGLGSFASLRDLGFPIGVPGTELVLKPDAAMPDEAFKRDFAPLIARVGEVIASFDNEPANCNVFAARYPEAKSVLLDTQCLPDPPTPAAEVVTVRDLRMAP